MFACSNRFSLFLPARVAGKARLAFPHIARLVGVLVIHLLLVVVVAQDALKHLDVVGIDVAVGADTLLQAVGTLVDPGIPSAARRFMIVFWRDRFASRNRVERRSAPRIPRGCRDSTLPRILWTSPDGNPEDSWIDLIRCSFCSCIDWTERNRPFRVFGIHT